MMVTGCEITIGYRFDAAHRLGTGRQDFSMGAMPNGHFTPLKDQGSLCLQAASSLQLVVFTRPCEKWAERAEAVPLLLAHRDIYLKLAESGEILFSGRFVGEPLLGLSVFDASVDTEKVRKHLENDPAVTGDYIALEFRTFVSTFGKFSPEGRKGP
jgi:hypothetical protein